MKDRSRAAWELTVFLLLALGATALLHGAIARLGLPFSLAPDSAALPLYLLGLATPAAAALVVTGRSRRRSFLRSILRPRGTPAVYAGALLMQPSILALAALLQSGREGYVSIGVSVSEDFLLFALGQLWVVMGEEVGWRGFALPRLEQLFPVRTATLVLAGAWGVWHAPMFGVTGSLQAREPIWFFGSAIFAWSCVHTALHQRTQPSIVPNLAFHAFANLTLHLVAVPAAARGALAAAYALVGVTVWLALGTPRREEAARDRVGRLPCDAPPPASRGDCP